MRQLDDRSRLLPRYKSIPTFLTLFIFAFLYELVLVWDALRLKNTIQIIGLALANLAILVYTAIQIDQIGSAISVLSDEGAIVSKPGTDEDLWTMIRPYLVAIPCIIAVASVLMAFISWKLYQEFAWDILKQIGADYRMKKRFLHYQVRPDNNRATVTPGANFTCLRSTLLCSSSISSSSSALPSSSSSSSRASRTPSLA